MRHRVTTKPKGIPNWRVPLRAILSALLKELAENSKEATKVRTTRTETSQQRQAPTHPALRVMTSDLANDPAHEMDNILIHSRRQAKKAELGTWTPRELSQNLQTPCPIGLRLPHPQPPSAVVRRPRARDTSFPSRALSNTAPSV